MNPKNLKCNQLDKEYKDLCNVMSSKVNLNDNINPQKFTGNKEVDTIIIQQVKDEDLKNICMVNKYIYIVYVRKKVFGEIEFLININY